MPVPTGKSWRSCDDPPVTGRSIALFVAAAIAEIGGAYLVWQAVREGRPWWLAALGGLLLFAYGFAASYQPDPHFGRIPAAYGGIFVAGSLAWWDRLRRLPPRPLGPHRQHLCLIGVTVIMYSPR